MRLYILVTLVCLIRPAIALTMKLQAAHKSNATLYCNYPHFRMPVTPWQIYWILPNETVIQPRFAGDSKFHVGHPPAYNLTVKNVDHKDFGWFFCVILWDNYHYLVDSVKVGLNVDGAIYDDLNEEYIEKVISGSVAAAVVLVILSLSCALFHYRFKSGTENVEEKAAMYEFDQAIKSFDQAVDDDDDDNDKSAIHNNRTEITTDGSSDQEESIDEKLNNVMDEAGGYAYVMRAYVPDGQEEVQMETITLDDLYSTDDKKTGITAF